MTARTQMNVFAFGSLALSIVLQVVMYVGDCPHPTSTVALVHLAIVSGVLFGTLNAHKSEDEWAARRRERQRGKSGNFGGYR